MISFIIAFIISAVCGALYGQLENATWGVYVTGVITYIASWIILNRLFQKEFTAKVNSVQTHILASQEKVQRQVKQFQAKPSGSPVAFQKGLEKKMSKAVEEALQLLNGVEKFYKWNFLLKKQVDTMRFQLNFQIRKFEEADKYIDGAIAMDPMVISMKMSRYYLQNPIKDDEKPNLKKWKVAQVFYKGLWKVRNQAQKAFLNNLYGWMLLQQGLAEDAQKYLAQVVDKASDEQLLKNLQALQNGNPKQYNMAAYGDQWWALGLQDPPKQKQKMQRAPQGGRGKGGRPF